MKGTEKIILEEDNRIDNLDVYDIIRLMMDNSECVKRFRKDIAYDIARIIAIDNEKKYAQRIWRLTENGTFLINADYELQYEPYSVLTDDKIIKEFILTYDEDCQERWSIYREE